MKTLLDEYEGALEKVLKAKTLAQAKEISAEALGEEPDDFIEEEDYIEEEELDFDN